MFPQKHNYHLAEKNLKAHWTVAQLRKTGIPKKDPPNYMYLASSSPLPVYCVCVGRGGGGSLINIDMAQGVNVAERYSGQGFICTIYSQTLSPLPRTHLLPLPLNIVPLPTRLLPFFSRHFLPQTPTPTSSEHCPPPHTLINEAVMIIPRIQTSTHLCFFEYFQI